ncbi:uncharacterized protein LOC133205818 [Saccostrea echinata]|uniref:uncharacterized protein LOC133205818 n=1 Tax=Saccostrea echinata TaxID=191078 RepID=UPI002A837480|nr:uncharacterized protein LOC133205818 [Saccostrea echinata]
MKMGSVSTHHEKTNEGVHVDTDKNPTFFHTVTTGACGLYSSHCDSAAMIDDSLSAVKVSTQEARALQRTLEREYFSHWNEKCEVQEYRGFSLSQTDLLVRQIGDSFGSFRTNILRQLSGIHFAEKLGVNIYEFTFGEKMSSGEVYFGMIAIAKNEHRDEMNAISCLYKLNFNLGKVKHKETRTFNLFGFIPVDESTETWYESKSLGFVTKNELVNFCRVKALGEFRRRNFISRMNDVYSVK